MNLVYVPSEKPKMNKVKQIAHNIKEWDKKMAKKIQEKCNLTDYQMLCLSFGKGFIIAAIIL